jgi:Tol biopolymer transport system component
VGVERTYTLLPVMTLPDKIGDFQVLSRIGEGGMGEVYRARDERLGRDVAIKVLPAALAADPDRLDRLAREARMLASLNHPNIAALYAVETSGPVHALVLELVEGETLGARLRRKPLSVAEVRTISRQIAAALDAAHACGIVHRDLKPDNVMLGPRGLVKVLDFGVAKASVVTPGADAPTLSVGPTAEGVIVGTVAYMSPEQARGLPVDRRTDIWAFGCVLYEMLTGRRAFRGGTTSDIIAATLEREPDWEALPPDTPPAMRRILTRTLQKDPHDRLRDIADAIPDLDDVAAGSVPAPRARDTWVPWMVAAFAVAMSAWLLLNASRRGSEDAIASSVITPITRDAGLTTAPALSRDGRLVAYASDRAGGGTLDIWVQQVDGGGAIRLTDDQADDTSPDFSPDGSQILFQSDRDGGGAFLVSAFGNTPPRPVARGARDARFSPDGSRIAYWAGAWRGGPITTMSGLFVVSLAGGEPQRLAAPFRSIRAPVWAPDGQSLLFLGRSDNTLPLADSFDWWWVKLDGSAPVKVGLLSDAAFRAAEAAPSVWTSDEVLFSDQKDLWSVAISPRDGQVLRRPQRLTVSAGSYGLPAVGPDGRIVFASTQNVRVIERASLDVPGRSQPPVVLHADFAADTGRPSVTEDGTLIVFERPTASGMEIWTKNIQTRIEQVITKVDSRFGLSATVSPEGARIAYTVSYGSGAIGDGYVVETARGVPVKVCEKCIAGGFLSDGRQLLISAGDTIRLHDVVSGRGLDVVSGETSLNRPHASPDDRWLAFRTTFGEGGGTFVTRLTPGEPKEPRAWVTIDTTWGGRPAGWSPDSRMVYLLLDSDGFRCLWGRPLDADGRPDGPVTAIRHFHGAEWAALSTSFGNAITPQGLLYGTIKSRGNVWSLTRPPQR